MGYTKSNVSLIFFSFDEKVKKGNNSYKWSEQIVESISKSFYDNSRPYEISGGIFNWNVDDVERASFFMQNDNNSFKLS
jgi:hypothetical protein